MPVLSTLRKHFPGARLEILGYPRIASLALLDNLAEAVHSIESPELSGFFASHGGLHPKWAAYFAKFDLIISYLSDPEKTLEQNIKRSSAAQFIAAPHRPNEAENLHATEAFLKPLEPLGIHDADSTPRLKVRKWESEQVSGPASLTFSPAHLPVYSILALHPGSGSAKKNWPEEKWAELLAWLGQNVKSSFLLTGGEAEAGKLERLAGQIPAHRLQLASNLPLPELAQKLSTARFFLGHDSGITHLAAALGLPGLVLWGESKLEIWHPRSDKMKILRAGPDLPTLPVATVIQKFAELWSRE